MPASAQSHGRKTVTETVDSVPWFNGFAVSVDLVGPLQMALGSYGQYEAALRLNLKDRYFPIIFPTVRKPPTDVSASILTC